MPELPTPGTYRLSQDVPNPFADRRKKSDWTKREVWRAGMLFIVLAEPVVMPEGIPDRTTIKVTVLNSLYSLSPSDPRSKAILAHLVAVQERPSQWLNRMDRGVNMAPDILDYLVASGKLTEADVRAAYSHCLDSGSAEEALEFDQS